jgi:hypothetical protein
MTPNVQTATTLIHTMDNDELNKIIRAIKDRRTYLTRQRAMSFAVGDRVSFAARGMQVLGTVAKINTKNVMVDQDNSFTTWKVPASLLSPVRKMVDAA